MRQTALLRDVESRECTPQCFRTRTATESRSYADARHGGYGGALSNNIDSVAVINSTAYSNSAGGGGGAFDLRGFTELQQVTSFNDTAPQGASVRFDAVVNSRNSVYSTGCFSPSALNMVEWGGSAQVTGQPNCAGTYYSTTQLALKFAYFGGRFEIVGIGSASSVLRNAAVPTAYLDMRDIRNHQRILPTDAGAHDADALP